MVGRVKKKECVLLEAGMTVCYVVMWIYIQMLVTYIRMYMYL